MELPRSSLVLLVLFAVDAVNSHQVSKGLSCVNDLVNNISCTWHGAPVAPGADCRISGQKKTWENGRPAKMIRSCQLKLKKSPPGCNFVFENNEFECFSAISYIRMECDGRLVGNLTDYDPCDHIKMHPPGVPNVSSSDDMTKISWSPGSPRSDFLTDLNFQVQIKQKHMAMEDIRNLSSPKPEIQILSWELKGHCQARVRVQPVGDYKSHWSDWSPTTSWMEATDGIDEEALQVSLVTWGVVGSLAVILVVLVVLLRYCMSRRIRQMKLVPTPSKYFHTLYSVHGGNLTKWVNPLSVPESFFVAQPCEQISPVELCDSWDVAPSTSPSSISTSALLHFKSYPSACSDTSGVVDNSSSSSSSCFSNMGYFMSNSSKSSAQTEPSPAYFVYQDDLHNLTKSHALHLSLGPPFNSTRTYESLKMEPQSPDSGFGLGREDEEDMINVFGNEDEMPEDHQISPLLILPLHLPPQMFPQATSPPSSNTPSPAQVSCDSLQVDEPAEAAGGSYAAWPSTGAMCRSSSMPVEPMKTGYLTLNELQATFSNKSI